MTSLRLALALLLTLAPLPALAAAPASPSPSDKLIALLRLDTTNPPGHEAVAAELIASWLRAEGVTPTLYTTAPGRKAVIARLKATKPELGPLMLLNHLDVVPVELSRWKHAPFGGEVTGGTLWGRGALDMKGLGVMELEAFLALKRSGVALRRDVIFCATPDEEAGGEAGVHWLIANHPEAIDATEILNEGGMGLVAPSGRPLLGIQTAERGTLWVRASVGGETGHGSRERPDSAPRRLLRALARLEAAPRPLEIIPETSAMLHALASVESGTRSMFLNALADPWVGGMLASRALAAEPTLAPLLGPTINPTVIVCGQKVNVIPGEARVELDMRMLPGHTTTEALGWLTATLGEPQMRFQVLHKQEPSRSKPAGPLWDALVAACGETYPGVPVTPILTPGGGTDSAPFRERGVQALGLMPILASQQQIDAQHGDDENIHLDQIAAGTQAVTRAVALAASR